MAGAKFAKESGVSAQDMMAGAQMAQKSGVTPQQLAQQRHSHCHYGIRVR